MGRVYVSLPLTGPTAPAGRDLLQGARVVSQRLPMACYGYEAMALVLDAIAAGDGDRAATLRAARGTRDRDSVLGRYSIDADGHTTSTANGRLAVVDGALAWDV